VVAFWWKGSAVVAMAKWDFAGSEIATGKKGFGE